jgi:hypothetical protein
MKLYTSESDPEGQTLLILTKPGTLKLLNNLDSQGSETQSEFDLSKDLLKCSNTTQIEVFDFVDEKNICIGISGG